MNCINLILKLGLCIVDFNGVLNNWSAIQEKFNKFFKKSMKISLWKAGVARFVKLLYDI